MNLYCYCGNDPVNYADPSGHISLAVIALIIIGVGAVAGGVIGGFSESSIYNNLAYLNSNAEGYQLSFWDRVGNVFLGAVLGASVGGAIVMLVAGGVAICVGGATVAVAVGGTAAQMFAIGALAYNALALISVAWSGKEADLIELPTVQLPG